MRDAADRRASVRARTRLRPGKVIDAAGRFMADCAILDRSGRGLRIRLFDAVDLPPECRLLDESDQVAVPVCTVWQSRFEAGLSTQGEAERIDRETYLRAAGPYYAVR